MNDEYGDQQLEELFDAHDKKGEQYLALLPKTDDIELVVLKGHLIVEELLFEMVAIHCNQRKPLEKARLTFAQLMQLAQALLKIPSMPFLWDTVAGLNGLRNSLVHNLEPQEIDKKVDDLWHGCGLSMKPDCQPLDGPLSTARKAREIVCYVTGVLSVQTPMATFIERKRNTVSAGRD